MEVNAVAEEKIVIGSDTKYPLNGILSIPKESTRLFPAVVLVHGSGPSNMDEKIGNVTPFKDMAEGLSEKGIAVLRYDKRTFVYGKEMRNNTGLSVKDETIEDAILAADFLRNDPRIDAEGGNFTGIIILGGSPCRLEEIMMDQNEDVLNSLNKFLKIIAKKQIARLSSKFDNIYNVSDEEAKRTLVIGKHVNAYYFKEMGEHQSTHYLKNLDKPLFILQGEKDFHVSVEKDFNAYKQLLSDKPNVTFKLYPNLNHAFMPSVFGEILKAKKEYKVAQHVDKEVINDISVWIHSI